MPQGLEKRSHEASAFIVHEPHGPGCFGMQKGTVQCIAPLGIRSPGDHAPDLTPKQGASAHDAGFQRHIERAFVQVFGT